MAENLKSDNEKDTNENKDKLQQMESRLKHIRDLLLEEASNVDGLDYEKMREKIGPRIEAAYSLEKMMYALREFRDAIAQREIQKFAQDPDSLTTNPPDDDSHEKIEEKRRQIGANEEG